MVCATRTDQSPGAARPPGMAGTPLRKPGGSPYMGYECTDDGMGRPGFHGSIRQATKNDRLSHGLRRRRAALLDQPTRRRPIGRNIEAIVGFMEARNAN